MNMLWVFSTALVLWTLIALAVSRPTRPDAPASWENQIYWLAYSRGLAGWERLRIFAGITFCCWLVICVLAGHSMLSAELRLQRDPCYRALTYFSTPSASQLLRGQECR